MRALVGLAAVLVLSAAPLDAQAAAGADPAPRPTGPVGGIGVGIGRLGVAGEAYVGAATRIGFFMARAAGTAEFDVNQSVNDTSSDLAILYGIASNPESGPWVRFAAGPAFVRTVRRGARRTQSTPSSFSSYTEQEESETIGLALQLDLAWGRRRSFGLGLLGNLNEAGSFAMALLSVHLGPSR